MKKSIHVFFALLLITTFIQCNDKEDEISHDTMPTQLHLWAENALLDVFKQIQTVVMDTSYNLLETKEGSMQFQSDCATIVFKEANTTQYDSLFIIYPNENCAGINDYKRKGTITVAFDGKYNDTLTNISIDFEKYAVNGIGIKSSMEIRSLGVLDGNLVHEIKADSLTISTTSGSYTWGAAYRLERISGGDSYYPNVGDDSYEITGSSYGYYQTEDDEVSLSTEIIIPLTYGLNCKNVKKGLAELSWNSESIHSINYGSGSCDNLVTVTIDAQEYSLTID